MNKIKPPSVAGTFYSANIDVLMRQIREFKTNSKNKYEYNSRATIVPHAGLIYSGQLGYDGINSLDPNLKTLFIFAPAHRVGFNGLSLSDYEYWETPLGQVKINQDINKELEEKFELNFFDKAFEEEHSIEIQLPLIQNIYENIEIVPILVGNADIEKIAEIIEHYWEDESIGFIISSDLSHFLKDSDAVKLDNITADMIETININGFKQQQACGAFGICALLSFARKKNYSLIRVGLINSSNTTGDTSSVVGYGSWFLYEGETIQFLKKYYSEQIIEICKKSIWGNLNDIMVVPDEMPAVFSQKGACFVTLEKQENLRGCIGSIIAHRKLIDDLIQNAQNAAFNDPRFKPLKQEELDDLSIAISLLSTPERMTFKDEEDLLDQIVPYTDGIIIKDGYQQAVYLPSVWDQLPDKTDFLTSLKIKAGMSPDYFSKTFEAYKYHSEYIK